MRRFIIRLAVICAALCLIFIPPAASASPVPDVGNGGTYICEEYAPVGQGCLDLKGNSTTADQPIWIYTDVPQAGATGLGWNLATQSTVCAGGSCGAPGPFTAGTGLNSRYNGQPVDYIEKKEGSGHDGCAGVHQGLVTWEPCGQNGTRWVESALGYFINVYYSDQGGAPIALTGLGTSNGSTVVIETLNNGFQDWTWFPSP